MMRVCLRCERVKFWFRFVSRFMGTHTEVSSICKRCGADLLWLAIGFYENERRKS